MDDVNFQKWESFARLDLTENVDFIWRGFIYSA